MCPSAVRYKIYIFQGLQNRSRTQKREIRPSPIKHQPRINYLSFPPQHYHQTPICSSTLTSKRTSSICAFSDRSYGLRSSKSKGGSSGRRAGGSVRFQTPGPPITSGIMCASFYRSNIPIASLVNGHVASKVSISDGFNHIRRTGLEGQFQSGRRDVLARLGTPVGRREKMSAENMKCRIMHQYVQSCVSGSRSVV